MKKFVFKGLQRSLTEKVLLRNRSRAYHEHVKSLLPTSNSKVTDINWVMMLVMRLQVLHANHKTTRTYFLIK